MSIAKLSENLRTKDVFHHIDAGFFNERLCLLALPEALKPYYFEHAQKGNDHLARLGNRHFLVTMLLDFCDAAEVPTLLQALEEGSPKKLFRSTEKLEPCPEIYDAKRVEHGVLLDIDFGKPVRIAYHTNHLCSDTGTMILCEGFKKGEYVESMIGLLHNKTDRFEIEPLVIGSPWFDHPRNGEDSSTLMWYGRDFGEIFPEDIQEFSKMREIKVENASEWQDVMRSMPEEKVKSAFASILKEPSKKDWGGEANDHFSGNLTFGGRRRTGAFLLKGPTNFREMTLEVCGKRADQIHRLTSSGAEIFIVQHSHMIGDVVRQTLRALTIYPGGKPRKYCLIDGMATYRILKAYGKLS